MTMMTPTCFDPARFDGLRGMHVNFDYYQADVDGFATIPRGDGPGHLSYGAKDQDKNGKWFVSDLTSGSDYSGGLVNKSNFKAVLEACLEADADPDVVPDECRPFFIELSGGYSTYALAFHIERTPDVIYDILAAAEDYPLVDEQLHSEMETEAEDEAWKNYVEHDYKRALVSAFEAVLAPGYIDLEIDLDNVADDDLYTHFREWADAANEYWEHSSEGPYIRVEKIAKAAAKSGDAKTLPAGTVILGRKKTEGNRMSDFFFGKNKPPPNGSGGGFMGLGSFDARARRRRR